MESHWKVARYAVANIRKRVLVLVDFQNDYYNINYWFIYLVSISRIAI